MIPAVMKNDGFQVEETNLSADPKSNREGPFCEVPGNLVHGNDCRALCAFSASSALFTAASIWHPVALGWFAELG